MAHALNIHDGQIRSSMLALAQQLAPEDVDTMSAAASTAYAILSDNRPSQRRAALLILTYLHQEGERLAGECCRMSLMDREPYVRMTAVNCLPMIYERYRDRAISRTLATLIRDEARTTDERHIAFVSFSIVTRPYGDVANLEQLAEGSFSLDRDVDWSVVDAYLDKTGNDEVDSR